jgi:PAS domain S-box-containing protein
MMTTSTERESDAERAALALTMVDKIPAMVAYWDDSQHCRFANHAYEKWFGVRPGAVIGMTMQELLGPLYALNSPHIERALRGEEQEFEREIPDPAHGLPRYSQERYIPHVVDGKVQGFCVLLADITPRRRAEQALQAMQYELEARDRLAAMATLAAGVAHEINNPLTAVLGNVEVALDLLEDGTIDTVALAGMLRDVRSAANRVSAIVSSMKLLGRSDAVKRERVSVADSLEQSIAFAANTLRYRARLVRELAPDLYVVANAAQLSQVFVNLLANAAHALPEGTPGQNEIRVKASRQGAQVLVEIADNGRGMQPELQSRIFEPFVTTKDAGEGKGLGLALSRTIVEGLGGKISVSSQAGQGSVFRVLLPAAEQVAAPPEPSAASAQNRPLSVPVAARPRLLIVDDEQVIASLLKHGLASEAYEVTTVNSGRAALTALEQERFDLILCDLMMPEMTGEDVYREATHRWPQLAPAFVFLTGGAFTPRGREFLASVDVPILEKPFRMHEVRELVSARLRAMRDDSSERSRGSLAG